METNTNQFAMDCDTSDFSNPSANQAAEEKKSKFDERNYLNTRLKDGEKTRTTKVRLLPVSATNRKVFAEVKTHSVKVPFEVSASGFKSFICLDDPNRPNYNPDVKCPICAKARELMAAASNYNPKYVGEKHRRMYAEAAEMEARGDTQGAIAKRKEADACLDKIDEAMSKSLYKAARNMEPKTTYFARVIERGKEADGVKFWRFNENSQGDGVWDKLTNLWKLRRQEMAEAGVNSSYDLFSVNDGRDINVTLTQQVEEKGEGASKKKVTKTIITISDVSFNTPLSKNIEEGNSWLTDEKQWSDCYAVKSPDYLAIIAEGKVPRFDKSQNKYVAEESGATGAQKTAQMAAETTQATTQYAAAANQPNQVTTQPNGAVPYNGSPSPQSDDLPF